MAGNDNKKWLKEFGLEDRSAPDFVSSKEELDAASAVMPQAHVIRRAFERLNIDGVLCIDNAPTVYFRSTEKLDSSAESSLLKLFWNQGVAPILVLIDSMNVRIFSGLVPPEAKQQAADSAPSPVETFARTSEVLQPFIRSVESGEFFQSKSRSFDPTKRVDRELLRNLQAARTKLAAVDGSSLKAHVIDAFLCRLVFTCYLFDRGVIDRKYLSEHGIDEAAHLTDILGCSSGAKAKADLYRLFAQLAEDFNGELFADDLDAETKQVDLSHIKIVDGFFRGKGASGQRVLWGYDFGIIPIETISAIYEHFLKASDPIEKHKAGAFYTPRFLAEFVLDRTLKGCKKLLNKRFLDPACGSGIFLVGLFNRLAEEWRRENPEAKYDRTASGLLQILRENLFGIDRNPTACRIAAFSLYLAFLDQLSPPDIRQLQRKGKFLPRLVSLQSGDDPTDTEVRTIRCMDFFDTKPDMFDASRGKTVKAHFVVGNPPWASGTNVRAPAAVWCKQQGIAIPDAQLANAFAWKAPTHLEDGGRVCFVLPHGILFKHSPSAVEFQRKFFQTYAVDEVVNLADYRLFLFEESKHAALVVTFGRSSPTSPKHRIDYLAPKADWSATRAEIISVLPQDRCSLTVGELLQDLAGKDAPLLWKRLTWATPRDWQFLDRLLLLPRLRDIVGQATKSTPKRWQIAEGFQPLGTNDDPELAKKLHLPSRKFIRASANALNLFLVPEECEDLHDPVIVVRGRSNTGLEAFKAPHVLVGKGFSRIAFAGFDVSFQHALRGIHGPPKDAALLMFLAAYLRSPLARYVMFHTSSNWGISRPEVHVAELLRLPFLVPDDEKDSKRRQEITRSVAATVAGAMRAIDKSLVHRPDVVRRASETVRPLIDEYFEVDDAEKLLIADTLQIIEPSIQPTFAMSDVRTVSPSTQNMRDDYARTLCEMLNGWASREWMVHCRVVADSSAGVCMAVLEKTRRGGRPSGLNMSAVEIIRAAQKVQKEASTTGGPMALIRGVKLFHKNRLFIFKPSGQRFWSQTAALNDADEIATTLLMRPTPEGA